MAKLANKLAPSIACALAALFLMGCAVNGAIVEHTFVVGNQTVRKLCQNNVITVVNGKLPGPTIQAQEGDTIVVNVFNHSPYNITIHWHGIFQLLSGWADGAAYVTQCPIVPGRGYTYKFNITGQEGTLWWHAHVSILRATVYGALIIRPRNGIKGYPFPKPYKEVPIILGEWWKANVVDIEREAYQSGTAQNVSDAFTINGCPGDLYPCSSKHTYKLKVVQGKTYLLRIINAAVNSQLFFRVAGHTLTVVAADASYTTPYSTDIVVIAPGQTVDALMVADALPDHYYMAAKAYQSAHVSPGVPAPYDETTTTGIVTYIPANLSATSPPVMPHMPVFDDTQTANQFYTSIVGLIRKARLQQLPAAASVVPLDIDEHMFITFGFGLTACKPDQPKCQKRALVASMNNVSFQFPTKMSLLEAQYKGSAKGVYTSDFPDNPPVVFDYTNPSVNSNPLNSETVKGTKLKKLRYNSTVEIVLQNTAFLGIENHPIHLHGFNFFVLAQGFGNYDATTLLGETGFNLVNPQERNTIPVPAGGWAVIRFRANNPGVWLMHCHLDAHMGWGIAMAFEVENGPTPSSTLPPPPPAFPTC